MFWERRLNIPLHCLCWTLDIVERALGNGVHSTPQSHSATKHDLWDPIVQRHNTSELRLKCSFLESQIYLGKLSKHKYKFDITSDISMIIWCILMEKTNHCDYTVYTRTSCTMEWANKRQIYADYQAIWLIWMSLFKRNEIKTNANRTFRWIGERDKYKWYLCN